MDITPSVLPLQHWFYDKLKWYTARVLISENFTAKDYIEILDWVANNIQNPYRHCRWRIDTDYIEFKFRYEKDYLLFALSW